MKNYVARCFQDVRGNYLTMEQSDKSVREIKALSEIEAWELLTEQTQKVDSEIPINERWNLHEVNTLK